jgi:hypothetical protein
MPNGGELPERTPAGYVLEHGQGVDTIRVVDEPVSGAGDPYHGRNKPILASEPRTVLVEGTQ